ncbi:hypothetical protein [Amycolatopsis sp. NPDC051102]|uniref:hypothetical protein n=1 Tax=Amycolatopsis sp. NPDC051102 TaxID=3155163 RepID=UPI00343B22FF
MSDGATILSEVDHDQRWRDRLLNLAAKQLAGPVVPSFNSVLQAMSGADPVLVQSLISELADTSSLDVRDRCRAVLADCRRANTSSPVVEDHLLPPPHPLDYEWRFTHDTRTQLASTALIRSPRSVLLLGCPTVAITLLSSHSDFRLTLVDDNPALPLLSNFVEGDHPRYRQVRADLTSTPNVTAGLRADVVIADAPFYPDAMAGFLHAAVAGTRQRGRILFALPPSGTRPTAKRDVGNFHRLAREAGLSHVSTRQGAVRYLRPPFERNAHRSAGLLSVEDDWRAADLATFVRGPDPATLSKPEGSSERSRWQEVVVTGKRWRVRVDEHSSAAVEGLLRKVSTSAILDTVSQRDSRRQLANVCTDDNEYFVTTNPSLLIQVLTSVIRGCDPVTQVGDSLGRPLTPMEHSEVRLLRELIEYRSMRPLTSD